MRFLITGGSGFIGTHLINALEKRECALFNIDKQRPKRESHLTYWRPCDILDVATLQDIVGSIEPTHLVHLAARTDTSGRCLSDYSDNTQGTANILNIIRKTPSISRSVITSTQFVHRPGTLPNSDEDFNPYTVYGESKVVCEQMVRQAQLSSAWTIIRPTNIWGPWHPRYPQEFWKILKKGLYLHPGRRPVMRSYGYVGNVIAQIEKILDAPPEVIDRRVLYVGDKPINLFDWANQFSLALTGKGVRVVPRGLLYPLALIGDVSTRWRINFPITTSRFRSMTQDYLTPMDPTIKLFGEGPYSLEQGIEETVRWLSAQGIFWHSGR